MRVEETSRNLSADVGAERAHVRSVKRVKMDIALNERSHMQGNATAGPAGGGRVSGH